MIAELRALLTVEHETFEFIRPGGEAVFIYERLWGQRAHRVRSPLTSTCVRQLDRSAN